jgi:Uma2 family endonuclease
MQTITKAWTDQEFMDLPDRGDRYEIIDGELITMGNAGAKHGYYASLINYFLQNHVRLNKLGIVFDSDTAFTMKSGNKRSPDCCFFSRERVKEFGGIPKGYINGAPDLAVEILSDGNTVAEIHQKIEEYFASGCRLVWVVHFDERYVLVYRQPEPDRLLKMGDNLDGDEVVPGFSLSLTELFTEPEF